MSKDYALSCAEHLANAVSVYHGASVLVRRQGIDAPRVCSKEGCAFDAVFTVYPLPKPRVVQKKLG